jgi:hypothetical protein
MKRALFTSAIAAAAALALIGARHRAATPPAAPPIVINKYRSIFLTESNDLAAFGFERVLQTLIDRSGATGTTPLSLYRQWFDTQNPKPGLAVADAPHCDDFITDGKPSFNGFPRRCPTPEGPLALSDPFASHEYLPIGITNRFDLTPLDGSNCGQYRIVYTNLTRHIPAKLQIIFEAVLPNPHPEAGVQGCRPVAQFWADLSAIDSDQERHARVERFFFDGIDGFPPVLRPEHFVAGAGRIRTSQQEPNSPDGLGRFYQFQLQKSGARLLVVPGLLENAPYATLYNSAILHPLGEEYRQFFISQVATLAIRDVNGFFDKIPEKYLLHESHPETLPLAFSSQTSFNVALSTAGGVGFNSAIAGELHRVGSTLSVSDVLARADTQNCQGCHRGDVVVGEGIRFPPGFIGNTHIASIQQRNDDGIARFWVSSALLNTFAPHRAQILSDFLAGKPLPVHSAGTIGGGRSSD